MKLGVVLTLASSLLTTACSHGTSPAPTRTTSATETRAPVDPPPPAGPSLYPMKLAFHDQNGVAIGLDSFRGHPVLLSMFYGSCPVACPLIVSHVKAVDARLTEGARTRTRVLLVSFDPEHDTPDAMRAIAQKHGVDPTRWTLATGREEDVRELAEAIGVTYRKLPEGGFAHTSVIVALDGEGRVIAREEGTEPNVDTLAATIRRAGGAQ